jgi:outer membrane lipoprotein-sorting protein
MARYLFTILFFSILTLAGCRTTSTLNLSNRSISSKDVQDAVRQHHARIQSMKGEGRISIESPDMTQSGSFTLKLQKPDSILIELRGPFGIKIGSVLVTRTEFLFYNSLENTLINGFSSAENLSRIFHVQISFDELLNLFSGGDFLEDDLHTPDAIHTENEQFVFIYSSSNSSRCYWINPTTMYIQKIQFLDHNGELTFEQVFGNFDNTDGFAIPHNINIKQPKTQQMLTLKYSDIAVNTEQLRFTFTIPHNAERIHW